VTGLGALAVAVLAVALAVAARLLAVHGGGARARSSRRFWWVVGAVVFLARVAYVAELGADLPYQDQWNAEGALLVAPHVDGRLEAGALAARHGEHLIVFTRITTLVLLELTGVWDATGAQLVVAVLTGALVGLLGARLARVLRLARRDELVLGGVALLLFATPLAWENILGGFQTQVLFCALFGVAALAGAADRRAALCLAAAGCAMASFAPGALAGLALFVVAHVERRGARPGPAALPWLALGGAALFVATTPLVPDHAHLRPSSLGQLVGAASQALAWPARSESLLVRGLLGLAWWSPLVALVVRLRCGEVAPALRPGARLVLALGVWAGLVLAAAVAARGGGAATASRYTELYALGTLANTAAILLLVRGRGGAARAGAGAWLALLCVCLACEVRPAAGLAAYRWQNQREQLAIARAVVDGADVSGVDTSVLWGITLDDLDRSLRRSSARERLPWSVRPCALDGTRRLAYEVPRATPVDPTDRVVLAIDRARTVVVVDDERAGADLAGLRGVRGPIPISALEVAWLRIRAASRWVAGVCGLMLLVAPVALRSPLRRRA